MLLADMTGNTEFASFGAMFAKTAIVTVGIVLVALVTLRFILPRLGGLRRRKGSRITVEDFQALDARRTVYILKIEDKRVAVGVSEQGFAKLCELNGEA